MSSLNLIEKIQQGDSRKSVFHWLGRATTPTTKNGIAVVVPSPGKTTSNKRAFGAELTNIDIHLRGVDLGRVNKVALFIVLSTLLVQENMNLMASINLGKRIGLRTGRAFLLHFDHSARTKYSVIFLPLCRSAKDMVF